MRRMAATQFRTACMQWQTLGSASLPKQQPHAFTSFRSPLAVHPSNPTKGISTRLYATGTKDASSNQPTSSMKHVLESRSKLRKSYPMELLRIAGVSFEGRQDAVSELKIQQGLAFIKESENPYDPNAVAVHTLDGIPLGYVPKERTEAFIHRICFGVVHSVGQQAEGRGLWGCSAEVQPRVPPVVVLPIPDNLTGQCHVSELLGKGPQWDSLKLEILKNAGGKCLITGAATDSVGEHWEVREKERVLHLLGFSALTPEVCRIMYMLESGENLKSELAVMNGWNEEDVEKYLGYIEKQRSSSGSGGEGEWRLDLKVLQNMGVEVPDELLSFVL